jgi:hypothetical protein
MERKREKNEILERMGWGERDKGAGGMGGGQERKKTCAKCRINYLVDILS